MSHSRCMTRSRIARGPAAVVARPIGSLFRPIGSLWRLRARVTLDMLVTLGVTAFAIGLAVGYQLVGRWARRSGA